MFTLSRKAAVSSLHALRRKVALETLSRLQPLLLLQMLVAVSQTVSSSVSNSQALAHTLLMSGQQRLQRLLATAPRLHLPVDRVLELCRSGDAEGTPEEAAAQALVELCLGLMLQWMAEYARQHRTTTVPSRQQRISPSYSLPYPSRRPPGARFWLCVPLARSF